MAGLASLLASAIFLSEKTKIKDFDRAKIAMTALIAYAFFRIFYVNSSSYSEVLMLSALGAFLSSFNAITTQSLRRTIAGASFLAPFMSLEFLIGRTMDFTIASISSYLLAKNLISAVWLNYTGVLFIFVLVTAMAPLREKKKIENVLVA
jgi:hypothetical protein